MQNIIIGGKNREILISPKKKSNPPFSSSSVNNLHWKIKLCTTPCKVKKLLGQFWWCFGSNKSRLKYIPNVHNGGEAGGSCGRACSCCSVTPANLWPLPVLLRIKGSKIPAPMPLTRYVGTGECPYPGYQRYFLKGLSGWPHTWVVI